METAFNDLLNTAIQDALRTSSTFRNGIIRSYFNSPPQGGYIINDEFEYILPDRDDVSSTLLLDIVTRFGSPGNESFIKNCRRKQIKDIGKYKKVKDHTHPDCPICLDDLKPGEYYRKLGCTHTFHKKCIDNWFKKDHSDCPMCRQKILN